MVRENISKYIILGVLSIQPLSGYGVKKFVDTSISNFCYISYGQIYLALNRLEEDCLATIKDFILISIGGIKLTAVGLHQKYFKFRIKSPCARSAGYVLIFALRQKMEEYLTGNKCEYCMRYVSMCPFGAIKSLFTFKGKTYSAVKANDLLKTMFEVYLMDRYDLNRKDLDVGKLAEEVLSNKELFQILLNGTQSKDNTVRNSAFNVLMILSEDKGEFLYPQWNYFQEMLKSPNNYHKYIAIYVLASLTRVDSENRFEKIFDDYYKIIEGDKTMTASHVVLNSSKIATNKPELKSEIIEKLMNTDKLHKGRQKELIKAYAIEALSKINPEADDKKRIENFVNSQLDSSSPKTRNAAQCYIDRCELE